MAKIIINDKELHLPKGVKVAMTYQAQKLSDMYDKRSNYSNQISAPVCKENQIIMDNAESLNSQTDVPYKIQDAKLITDQGNEIIPRGIVFIDEATKTDYKLTLNSGNISFFDAIKGKKMTDLDLSAYDHCLDENLVITSRNNTSGYIYPIIDYGMLGADNDSFFLSLLFPAMFIHTLLEEIYKQAGWSWDGKLKTDPDLLELIMPWCSQTLYMTDNANEECLVWFCGDPAGSGDFTFLPNTGQLHPVKNFCTVYDNSSFCGASAGATNYSGFSYRIPANGFYKFEASLMFTAAGVPGAIDVDLHLKEGSGFFKTVTKSYPTGNVTDTILLTTDYVYFEENHYIQTWWSHSDNNLTFIIIASQANTYFKVVDAKKLSQTSGHVAEMSNSMPDMLQSDFIKGVAQWFKAIFVTDDQAKKVKWVQFKEIVQNCLAAKNMQRKHDSKDDVITFRDENFYKKNLVNWKEDNTLSVEGYENHSFDIQDELLSPEGEVINSPFGATEMVQVFKAIQSNLYTASINKYPNLNPGTRPENKIAPRFLRLNRTNLPLSSPISYKYYNSLGVIVDVHVAINVPLTYFQHPLIPKGLGWPSLFDQHYKEFLNIFNKYKGVSAGINLDDIDVNEWTPEIPWYLPEYEAYFYVNIIKDYITGLRTTNELIRIA